MKKIIIVLYFPLIYVFLANFVVAQDKYEAPGLIVGDNWTFEKASGKEFKVEVVGVGEEGYEIKGEMAGIYDKETLNHKFVIEKGRKVKSEAIFRKKINSPLFVGKKWTDRVDFRGTSSGRMDRSMVLEYEVQALEDVSTPAGTFKALRIFSKRWVIDNMQNKAWAKYWYSPEVRYWVKREFENVSYFFGFLTEENAVLINYKLEQR